MKRLTILFLSLAVAVPLVWSCGRGEVREILKESEAVLDEAPALVLSRLETIPGSSLDTRKLRAEYALLHAMALDKSYIDTSDVDVVMPAVDYYSRRGNYVGRSRSYYYLGRIQYNGGSYAEAAVSFTEALEALQDDGDMKFRSLALQSLADTYGASYLFEEAVAYSDSSYRCSLRAGDYEMATASLFRKAQNLGNAGHSTEADSLFRRLVAENDSTLSYYGRILKSYALFLCTSPEYKDYSASVGLFERASRLDGGLGEDNYIGAYAFCLAASGRFKESAEVRAKMSGDSDVSMIWRGKEAALSSDYRSAYGLLEDYVSRQSDLLPLQVRQSAARAQRDYFAMKSNEARDKIKSQRLTAVLVFLLLVMAVLAVVSILRRRNGKLTQEREAFRELAERFNSQLCEMSSARETLKSAYANIYKSSFKKLGMLVETYALSEKRENPEAYVYREGKKLLSDIRGDSQSQIRFEKRINDDLNGIMARFRLDFPAFSEDDYRFVSYMIAGFDSSTIMTLLDFPSQAAVYSKKYRIKKIVSDSDSDHREDYLAMLG